MAEPRIKAEPDALGGSPGALTEEDDIYEDAGDLEFNTDPKFQSLYLARVPKYMWEAWSKLDDDAEIQIGTIRQSTTAEGGTRLQMLLSSNVAEHQTIPKEYDLDITDESVKNTFVFTEKDLPGFKSRSRAKFDLASANMPSRLTRVKNEKPKQAYDPNKKFQPYVRKAIPKRTTLAGRVAHEVNCVAVDNPEAQHLLALRTLEAMRPKHHTTFLATKESADELKLLQPGSMTAQDSFGGFIKHPAATSKTRPQLTKTARMPENELLDKIYTCFRRYKYWPMKALRAELQQPEAYLRETLDKIAVLDKSGRFATHWHLKMEQGDFEGVGDEVAPMTNMDGNNESDIGDEEDDDDDEDTKFIDV